jgi:ferredoxin, 2Fe-2S
MANVTFVSQDGAAYVVKASPGTSLMQLATSNAVPGIVAECGGVLSCATCHVYVDPDWYDRLEAPSQSERDMLEFADYPQATSRLSCQIRFRDELDGMILRIPATQ